MLTVLLQPVALASLHAAPALAASAFASETLIGLAIGLGVAILVGAAETAGDVMAVQMGLSGAALLDPLDTTQAPVLGTFTRLFATTLLLSLNFHYVMFGALADSTERFPVGAPVSLQGGTLAVLQLGSTLFVLGVRFAAPVIVAVMIANVALAVLGRAAPQLNILTVAFPLQITIGLFALLAALPAMARFFAGWTGTYNDMMTHVASGLPARWLTSENPDDGRRKRTGKDEAATPENARRRWTRGGSPFRRTPECGVPARGCVRRQLRRADRVDARHEPVRVRPARHRRRGGSPAHCSTCSRAPGASSCSS